MPDSAAILAARKDRDYLESRGIFCEGGTGWDLNEIPSSILAIALAARKDYASDDLPHWVTDEAITQSPRVWALLAEIAAEKRIAREKVADRAMTMQAERNMREIDGRRG